MVALGGDDGLCRIHDVSAGHIEERLSEEWPRIELAMAHAESAADKDRVTFHGTIHHVRHKTDILRIDIHVVVRLDGDAHLEFPRQVEPAVDRIVGFRGVR